MYTTTEVGETLYIWKSVPVTETGISGTLIGYVKDGQVFLY